MEPGPLNSDDTMIERDDKPSL